MSRNPSVLFQDVMFILISHMYIYLTSFLQITDILLPFAINCALKYESSFFNIACVQLYLESPLKLKENLFRAERTNRTVKIGNLLSKSSLMYTTSLYRVIFEEPSSVLDNLRVYREQILIHNQKGDSILQLCLHRTEIS